MTINDVSNITMHIILDGYFFQPTRVEFVQDTRGFQCTHTPCRCCNSRMALFTGTVPSSQPTIVACQPLLVKGDTTQFQVRAGQCNVCRSVYVVTEAR